MSGTKVIDLRSDTVTQPTPAMRKAMAEAEVGDDVMGEDPTINRLQQAVAEMLGKPAALFVPSGTMGNLICALAHCERRDAEMIVGDQSHMHIFEQGNSAMLGGIHSRTAPNQRDGTLLLKDIEERIRTVDDHFPVTQLVCLENTHNKCGGVCLTPEYTDQVGDLCRRHGLKLHIDGARIMNAAVALGVSVARLVAAADSISMCLSKGLASPVGSVIAGSAAFIIQARRLRKALGGGMRQAGVLAACGLVSITTMVPRLADDHKNAKVLASAIAKIDGLSVDLPTVQSNIVFVNVDAKALGGTMDAKQLQTALRQQGVLVGAYGTTRLRFITHYHVSSDDVQNVVQQLTSICTRARASVI